ncbi:MAG TPA: glucuronate isomerase, partial [bacterium]|nr:glucuronate isomerase [bacterium]
MIVTPQNLKAIVENLVDSTPVVDMHTHIYPPAFGPLLLWGIDELLTYHYLVAEVTRVAPVPLDKFWTWPKKEQADYIWEHLFIRRAPISEACRGVATCLQAAGLDPNERNLETIRAYYRAQKAEDYVESVFVKANVKYAVMTNDPFDPAERKVWERGGFSHPRFQAALRVDPLLMNWETASSLLRGMEYEVSPGLNEKSLSEIRRFLEHWADIMKPRYLAVSLTPDFHYPDETLRARVLDACILPFARERNLPFALMIGVRRQINPGLKLAGDGVGRADLGSVVQLCLQYPD